MQHLYKDFYIERSNRLGFGSYGSVYKGQWRKDNTSIEIAIKEVDCEIFNQEQVFKLTKLNELTHQNIVKLYDATLHPIQVKIKKQQNQERFCTYIFMELCQQSLRTKLNNLKQKNKIMPQLQVLQFIGQIINGMCYINAKNILHRDLKPQNILISFDNKIKIADFGHGREQINNDYLSSNKGTRFYAAPQVYLQNGNYGKNCDVWSCGLILYEMLSGTYLNKDYPDQIKTFWKVMRQGRIKYQFQKLPSKIHHFWEYFISIMLTYNPKQRKTFKDLLQIYKTISPIIKYQLTHKGKHIYQNKQTVKLQKYLKFNHKKNQIFMKIFKKFFQFFDNEKFTISNKQDKLFGICFFIMLCKHFAHNKKLFMSDKSHFYLPGSQNNMISDKIDYQRIVLIDFFREKFKKQNTFIVFYTAQICEKLKKASHITIIQEQIDKTIFNCIEDIQQDLSLDQQSYSKLLFKIFETYFLNIPFNQLQKSPFHYLQNYLYVFLGANIDKLLPDQQYNNKNKKFVEIDRSFDYKTKQQLLQIIHQSVIKVINQWKNQKKFTTHFKEFDSQQSL